MSGTGEVSSTNSTFKWIIGFCGGCKKTGEALVSPEFPTIIKNTVYKWQLLLCPKGNGEHYKDFISIYVRKLTIGNVEVTVKLSLLNAKNKEEKTCFVKPMGKSNNYDAWGKHDFIKRTVVLNEENGLLTNDALTILCEIIEGRVRSNRTVDFPPPGFLDIHGFETLLDEEKYSDIVFTVDDKVIRAHKCILANKSDVFAAMFAHDTIEQKQNVVEITDISYDILKEMLRFIYAGKINDIKKVAADLLPVADKYLLEGLKTMCEKSLSANLNIENVIEYVRLADTHNADVLKTKAIQFIVSNSDKVMDKPELKNLSQLHPEVMCAIFRAVSTKIKTESND